MALFAAPPQISPLAAANPLQDLIAGLQQGLQLRQLPQQIADQELQKRLNNALLAQKLADLQNPEQALTRKITEELALKGALNPDLGIQKAPAGLTGETIFNPQAIPFTGNELENALRESVGMAVPSAAPLQPTTPIAPFGIQTGLNLNPNAPVQAAERDFLQGLAKKQQESDIIQNRQIAVDAAKEAGKAKLPAKVTAKQEGNFIVKRDSQTQEKVGEPEPIPQGSKFVTIAGVGSGFVNEDTQEFSPIKGTEPSVASGELIPIYNPNGSGEIMGYTAPKGFKSVKDLGGAAPGEGTSSFQEAAADRNLSSIADLRSRVGINTVGPGAILSKIPGTDATDFSADLQTLISNITFGELQAMRADSKTGGALGQVSDKEGKLLGATLGALDTRQSPANFKKNLNNIEASINRWKAERVKHAAKTPSQVPSGNAPLIINSITPIQ